MAKHVMHDLELLALDSTKPAFLAIGAVLFDSSGILDRFEVGIDPADCQRYGLEIEGGTVMWWFDQKQDAARSYINALGKVDLFAALDGFGMWMSQTPTDERGSLWGNGAMFDNTRTKSAYDAVQLEMPVTYNQHECYRTMKNRFPDVPFNPTVGIAHTALADAENQALHLIEICAAHGIKL